ncbi:fungal-specific transcription factor domain-domain-containing protein [Naematelia encephala]|uniref:Fungal-specific transcription factor domain-domain-containing protein n=1 Tax=Naematelia encephala TaxID=71784 RepID=A0A1Y2AEY4_9TREE|nr:fungal-specific transcription factor domain-domain-containing protein [Naematelia encephala]
MDPGGNDTFDKEAHSSQQGSSHQRLGQPDRSKHLKQRLVCGIQGCGKAFNRKDHLTRHQANHGTQSHPCDRCKKSFQRLDLLARHRARHDIRRNGSNRLACTPTSPPTLPALASAGQMLSGRQDADVIPADLGFLDHPLAGMSAISRIETLPHAEEYCDTSSDPAPSLVGPQVLPPVEMDWFATSLNADPLPINDWEQFLMDLNGAPTDVPVDLSWRDAFAPEMEYEGLVPTALAPLAREASAGGDCMASETSRLGSTLLDEKTRLELISTFPELPMLSSHPLFTCASLQAALDAYWEVFHVQIPMLHRKTFLASATRSTKLAIMVVIGQYHFPSPVTEFAEISLFIRARLLLDVTPDMTLVTFQTLLLCHIYDEFMSSSSAQFSAQCFCPTLVSVARRRSLLVRQGARQGETTRGREDQAMSLEQEWLAWVEEELAVRAAYTMWYIDSQLTAYWGQVCGRRHSVFSIQIRLPCSSVQWEASSAGDWSLARRTCPLPSHQQSRTDNTFLPGIDMTHQPKRALPGFSSSVKAALNASQEVDGSATAWTRLLLLHGLNAIVWDAKMHGSIALYGEVSNTWKTTLHYAMLKLRDPAFSSDTPLIAVKVYRDATALSLFSMYSDIVLLQVFAGADVVSGCRVGTQQYVAARRKLLSWIKTEDGRLAKWHAATYLEDVYRDDLAEKSPMTTAWTVYLATIICWAFSTLLTSRPMSPLTCKPPPQLAIPGALAFIGTVASGRLEDLDSGDQTVRNQFNLLAAADFFVISKSPHWGVGKLYSLLSQRPKLMPRALAIDASKTLKTLMASMVSE